MPVSPVNHWYRETLRSIIEEQATERPEDVFAIYGPTGERITYAELHTATNRIANSLLDLGVAPGDRVSVMSSNSLQTVMVIYACSKAGLIYCPINYNYEGTPLSYQLNDTSPDLLLIDEGYLDRVERIADSLNGTIRYIQMDTDREYSDRIPSLERAGVFDQLFDGSSDSVPVEPTWKDTAWIIYTSGTTGDPKGVALPHRWILTNHAGYASLHHDSEDVIHSTLPFYHIGGASFEVTATLLSGATVVMWDQYSTDDYLERIRRYGATTSLIAGVMINWQMDKYADREHVESPLRKVHIQPLVEEYENFTEKFGVDFVSVAFGQTESGLPITGMIDTRDATRREEDQPELLDRLERCGVPVVTEPPGERYMGKLRSDIVDASVVDENGEDVGTREVGELVLRPSVSFTLFERYINNPEKTVDELENLWFHTGDYVSRDEGGNYYFVDRDRNVIRRRGENISSKRVQDIVNQLAGIVQTAAFPIPASHGGEDEVGIAVVIKNGHSVTPSELRDRLASEMPDYMIPAHIWIVDRIPETPTNKMKKEELKDWLLDR